MLSDIFKECAPTKGSHHVIVDKDIFGAGLHFVVVDVTDDDSQSRRARHGRIARIFDDDGHVEFLLLLAVERTQRRNDRHSVPVGSLCKRNIKRFFF